MTEDPGLIKRARAGDSRAFDELVRRYQDGLFRHLLRLTGRPEDAEDLCQEAFVALYGALRRFDPARPLAPYLFTIATNAWRMRIRRLGHKEQPLGDQQPGGDASIAEQVRLRLEHQQVLAAVAKLRPEQREAVSLYYDQGLSYREIARITRVPVGTVSTRLCRALDALRRLLASGAAGFALATSGPEPLGTSLITALQGQGVAPAGVAAAVAHGIAHTAPTGIGLLYGIASLWKEAGVMVKTLYVMLGVAVVGGATLGVPRLVSHGEAAQRRMGTEGRSDVRREASATVGNAAALPRVPKMVSELYLPEEQKASGALYNLYNSLTPAQLATLEKGGKVTVEAAKLSPQFRATLSAWFNSARWGCEPPAEQVTAETVRQATAVFVSKDQVVDFSLQSPQQHIWKTLTVACSPEKAAWVRDGLPLLPSWYEKPWDGGTRPPAPARKPAGDIAFHDYVILRYAYRVYAELPAASLRRLHNLHTLDVPFAALPISSRHSLAAAYDEHRFKSRAFGVPDTYGRPAELRRRLYGITRVRFMYARSHPGLDVPWPQGGGGLARFPRPHRVVYLEYDPLVPTLDRRMPATWDNPPLSKFVHSNPPTVYLVAWPPEIQRKVLIWQDKVRKWLSKWQYQEGGQTYNRPGAPPFPSDPWGGATPAGGGG